MQRGMQKTVKRSIKMKNYIKFKIKTYQYNYKAGTFSSFLNTRNETDGKGGKEGTERRREGRHKGKIDI